MIFAFDEWELDTELFELRRDGEVQKVEPKAFNLLRFLVRNRDRVVTKDEVVEEIWDGRIVTEATISTCLKAARQALGDDGKTQRYIKTAHGRGFRFVGDIADEPTSGPTAEVVATIRSAELDWTSLALLPFNVFSDDPELEFFADGLVEDLTTILSRVPDLTVISRSSSFAYKGMSPSAKQVRDELGVSHMVEGSVRAAGDRMRINVQLVDTSDGRHVWAERFDRPRADTLDLEEEIIRSIAQRVEPELAKVSYDRARSLDCNRDAWLLYQQAVGLLAVKGWQESTFAESADLLRRSIEIESNFARAHAYLALILGLGQRIGLLVEREACVAESRRAADRALALDDTDSTVLGYAGCALSDIGEARRGLPLLESAVERDPSNAQAWAALGSTKIVVKRLQDGITDLQHGIRISPLDSRLAVWGSFLAFALMVSGDIEGALAEAETACRRDAKNHLPRVMYSAIAVGAGKSEEASAALEEAYRIRPDLSEREIAYLVGQRSFDALRSVGAL